MSGIKELDLKYSLNIIECTKKRRRTLIKGKKNFFFSNDFDRSILPVELSIGKFDG